MVFGKTSLVLNPIVLDGVAINKVDSTKFLGVLLTDSLGTLFKFDNRLSKAWLGFVENT